MRLVSSDLMAASQSRSAGGQTAGFAAKFSKKVAARIDVTAITTDVQFFLESSNDNSNWAIVYTMSALGSGDTGAALQLFPIHEGYVRVRWTIAGASATFSVKLIRHE